MGTIKILGVNISNTTKEEGLEFIVRGLDKRDKKLSIFTPNPEIIVAAQKDEAFKKIINTADLALADGIGVIVAGQMLGKPLKTRITGVDFMLALVETAVKRGLAVGLLGGGPKIAERTAECLLRKHPSLKIIFAGEEWLFASPASGSPRLNIDILFVALGYPKQERWIYENLPKIPVRVAMAVGGSFDYISGEVPQAPLFMRNLGLEWLFRLIVQPWRIRRQLALADFIYEVLKTRFSRNGGSS